jgi:hypothetical protein
LEKGAALIAEGYSDSRIQAFSGQQRNFVEFCELDGYEWETAWKHAMVAWIAYRFESSNIAGD